MNGGNELECWLVLRVEAWAAAVGRSRSWEWGNSGGSVVGVPDRVQDRVRRKWSKGDWVTSSPKSPLKKKFFSLHGNKVNFKR